MLFKLSVSNIRRSLRDYAIYFFTLIIGVSVFYVFNAIDSQAAMYWYYTDSREMLRILRLLLSGTSAFVAVVFGLLIVYASRFLMKRRNREFALYMTLGMSKGKISALLLIETLIIGIGSLGVGLLAGIGLSQLTSVLVINLFDADMTAYRFNVSGDAVLKTMLNFGIIYLVVMLFNSVMIGKMKLITLMQSGKRPERISLRSPIVCAVVFVIACVMLAASYYQVDWKIEKLEESTLLLCIAGGALGTFLLFWSVAGMLLRVIMSIKKIYHNSLNAFTFRQLSSKVGTMVFSMTVICLMLFVTICALSGAFSMRNAMNSNLEELCPVDAQFATISFEPSDDFDMEGDLELCGIDLSEHFEAYETMRCYGDESFRFFDFVDVEMPQMNDYVQTIAAVSDYNRLMRFYGRDEVELDEGQYVLVCNFKPAREVQDLMLAKGKEITVFGETLAPRDKACRNGFVLMSGSKDNYGIFIVPDDVADGQSVMMESAAIKYGDVDREQHKELDREFNHLFTQLLLPNMDKLSVTEHVWHQYVTWSDIAESNVGLGAVVTFLGLYIGLVFLIACGAILALKELSESVDSIGRYEILRRIGADERDISKSLFRQTGIFFLLPLLLACVHSIFGLRFAAYFLELLGTEKLWQSILSTSFIILLIYGGYFLITYFCSKGIIRGKRQENQFF